MFSCFKRVITAPPKWGNSSKMGNCLSSKYAVIPGGYRPKKSSVKRLKRHNYVTVGNYFKIYLKETKIDLTVEVITGHNYRRSFIFV